MRLSAFILNLLVLMMILAPCRDHKGWGNTQDQQFHEATKSHEAADDDCSPLCTCSCCASVSVRIHTPEVEGIAPAPVAKKFPVYIAPGCAAELSAVWQPPRIG